ncbi:MAG: hypothetical protein Q4Q53_07495 [Methanocorpusculum sp.]|nr:hypothetical protein [Methanocorpusculum sp.]
MEDIEIQKITDRISQSLESKGASPDRSIITEKLKLYINEFGVVAFEAERKVLADQYKRFNIFDDTQRSAGGTKTPGEVTAISDIVPNQWVILEGKIVSLQKPNSDSISQSGVIADNSGAVRFVVFSKATAVPKLELEKWYRIESAVVDSFRNVPNIKLHSGSHVTEIEDDLCLMPSSPVRLADVKPGVIPCIRTKFVEEWDLRGGRMMQNGLLADESGRMKFVIWQDEEKEKLVLGNVYNIFYASVDEFNGRYSLGLNSALWIQDEETDINVKVKEGIPAPTEALPVTTIHDLKVGYASLRVKFIEEWESRSDKMLQAGLVGDETGRIKFVIWRDDKKEKLEVGRVYNITNAKVDEFNGRLSISLNPSVYEADAKGADIVVGEKLDEVSGNIVQISGGSGLIKRCPVEGCGRVLSRQNLCPVHEIQNNFKYDLRIKGVVDDGHKANNVLMNREITELLSGITLEEAIEIGTNSPLGLDEVLAQLGDRLCGRYVRCSGNDIDGRLLVKNAEFIKFDKSAITEIINRAGVSGGEQ